MYKSLYIPNHYDKNKVAAMVETLLDLAKSKHGGVMSYPGFETNWADCCTGFERSDGRFHALLTYNVGVYSFSVSGVFDLTA